MKTSPRLQTARAPIYLTNAERRRLAALERKREFCKRNPEYARDKHRARRAREMGAPVVEIISRALIIERDKGICHICGTKVEDVSDIHLDHVIPLARGGEHTARNLKVSHSLCNLRKGAS